MKPNESTSIFLKQAWVLGSQGRDESLCVFEEGDFKRYKGQMSYR